MTLAESKLTKIMEVKCKLPPSVDLARLWEQIHFIPTSHLGFLDKHYTVTFYGKFDDGHVVVDRLIGAAQAAQVNCHLEVSCHYE